MISVVCTQASLLITPCGSSSLGPSSALSYAVGIVPHIRQLQAKDRGFHVETLVSTQQVSTRDSAFHYEAGLQLRRLRHGPIRQPQQQVRVSLNGAL